MKNLLAKAVLSGAVMSSVACSFHARSPDDYRDVTQALLETRAPAIKQCYDAALRGQPDLQGSVVVAFTVQSETGNVIDASVAPEGTTAPEALQQCVLTALSGLTLDPPDARDGHATFTYEFAINPPPPEPAA